MSRTVRALLALYVLVVLAAVGGAAPAAADDSRIVGDGYRITAAWATTPVYPEELNALVIRVTDPQGQPVTGLEHTLRLRIGVPNQVTETWGLTPDPAAPGVYRVALSLPKAAVYVMDLQGTVHGTAVRERFVSGENGLEPVIAHPRQYPRGSWIVVLVTVGFYLVGLAYLCGRGAWAWLQRRRARAAVGR
jgi:hypothetical protein